MVAIIISFNRVFCADGQMTIGMIMFHVSSFSKRGIADRQLHRIYDQVNDALTYAEGL